MKICLYIHGKGGNATEAEFYRPLFDCEVIGLDYDEYRPWIAKELVLSKYQELAQSYDEVIVIANSIGAWFTMLALSDQPIKKAYFISPMVDMEGLICNMMTWANVTEAELKERGEIETSFGETLSWDYLCFVRANPIRWTPPTAIAYGDKDHLVGLETIKNFANQLNAMLSVLPNGEHWFHTPKQMNFLRDWISNS